jgi:carboxymethylenebutenolidase
VPETTLLTPAGPVRAHLALPEGAGPWPGVVVLHEIFGLNDDIREHAERFAGRGYLALAPDLFSCDGPRLRCVLAAFRSLNRRSGAAFEAIGAARGALADREDSTGRVGVVGFCMGGGFALVAAPRFDFAAAAPNYGVVPRDAERLLRGACPIVGSYGRRDRFLRGSAERLDAALAANGIERDVKEYPEASHSFLNRHRGRVVPLIERVTGVGFHGPSAEDALRRIDAFLDRHVAQRAG